MLSDRRLKTSHEVLEMRMRVKINDKNWSDKGWNEILEKATKIYLSSRRKRKLDVTNEKNVSTKTKKSKGGSKKN